MVRTVLLCLCFTGSVCAQAGDWSQILGPNRNGIADKSEQIVVDWTDGQPRELWNRELGSGFAGPAVRDGKVYQIHRQGEELILDCLDANTGKRLWDVRHPCEYVPSISYDDGPRCVPAVTENLVITFGPAGILQAVDVVQGEVRWRIDTHKKYRADAGYFGAGSSPIVIGDRVIVNVGGSRAGAGLAAFSLKDGTELWAATSEGASYSSPVATTFGDQSAVIFVTRMNCLAVNPADGSVLFEFPFGKRGPTVNAANPVVNGDKLFLTASYGVGAVYGRITKTGFTPAWSSDELLSSQYTTPIVHEGYLYGIHGRQDGGYAELRCVDFKQQKVLWSERLPSYGTLLLADEKLLVTTIDGSLIVVGTNPQEYQVLAEAKIQSATQGGLALPALSNGRLILRDGKKLRCLELGKTR
jgi:outer membrane protein assembly factor BamB